MTVDQQKEIDKAWEEIRRQRKIEEKQGITWHGGIRYRNGKIDVKP